MKSFINQFILIVSAFLFGSTVFAQTVIRGPYLQSPTENTIVIKWRTDVSCNSRVNYGTSLGNLNQIASSSVPKTEHTITLTNLLPSTTYYYEVGNTTSIFTTASEAYRFKTNPIPGVAVPTRVWAIGDFGKGNTEQVAVKNSFMQYDDSSKTDVWIWLGDNVYNDGTDEEYQTKLFELNGFSNVFNWLPFWPSLGLF